MIVSPCVDVCQLHPDLGLCLGCARTLDEIARWRTMTDAERAAVMGALSARRARHALPPPPGGGSRDPGDLR